MKFYIQIRETVLPSRKVIYVRRTGAYGDKNRELMNRFKIWLRENRLYDSKTTIWAVPLDNPFLTEPGLCRYDVCTEKPENGIDSGEEIQSRELPGGRYIVFLIWHTAEAVAAAWETCFEETVLQKYMSDGNRPVMECYRKELVDRHCCELYVPVL